MLTSAHPASKGQKTEPYKCDKGSCCLGGFERKHLAHEVQVASERWRHRGHEVEKSCNCDRG